MARCYFCLKSRRVSWVARARRAGSGLAHLATLSCPHWRQDGLCRVQLVPLLSIIDDEEARTVARAFVSGIGDELRFDRSLRPEAIVLRVIRDLTASAKGSTVALSDITAQVIDRHSKDFDRFVTPRYIGELIRKRLRIATYKSHGVYVIPLVETEKIAFLAERYGVNGA